MKSTSLATIAFATVIVSMNASSALASLTGQLLGTAAPSGVIDGVSMTPFPADSNPLFFGVTSIASPLGGDVGISPELVHMLVGLGWSTWSHGYTGDVYTGADAGTVVTLSLPANTQAFYLYVEPNDGIQPFSLTATGSGGGSHILNDSIFWQASAKGFFFRADGETLTSIQISTGGDQSYAIGEFGIAAAVPAPGALALLGLAGTAGAGSRRRRA